MELRRRHPGRGAERLGRCRVGAESLGVVVLDSLSQCRERGEIAKALQARAILDSEIVELGDIVRGEAPGRVRPEQITIADLTGVAVQDVRIAAAIYRAL